MSSADKAKSLDYEKLAPTAKNGGESEACATVKPSARQISAKIAAAPGSLINPNLRINKSPMSESVSETPGKTQAEISFEATNIEPAKIESLNNAPRRADLQKLKKEEEKAEKDRRLLGGDPWLARNGHNLTYAGIFLFTLFVYFRPYELIPALSDFSSIALVIAVATLLVYLPTQFASESSLTILSTEIKCILFIAFWALLTMPIAKDPSIAWSVFSGIFVKVIVIFIVMVNSLRTSARLKGLMWLAVGVGVMLSCQALYYSSQGIFKIEGYRVNVDVGGMFGNPNDLALHLVMVTPVAIALGLATRNIIWRLFCFAMAGLMIAGSMVTQSRGGFLGLIAVSAVLVWKLGRNRRFKVILISLVFGLLIIAVAPGNYGSRILSIVNPSLDKFGSSNQRSELLIHSLWVTARNPLGIGLGNFPVVSYWQLQTHNAYTQVSSELGWFAFAAYLILMVSPLRKLGAIERQLFAADEKDSARLYYLTVGVQACIIGYMVASFFDAVAYNWYIYYPIAYAVCLRRLYRAGQIEKGVETDREPRLSNYFDFQKA